MLITLSICRALRIMTGSNGACGSISLKMNLTETIFITDEFLMTHCHSSERTFPECSSDVYLCRLGTQHGRRPCEEGNKQRIFWEGNNAYVVRKERVTFWTSLICSVLSSQLFIFRSDCRHSDCSPFHSADYVQLLFPLKEVFSTTLFSTKTPISLYLCSLIWYAFTYLNQWTTQVCLYLLANSPIRRASAYNDCQLFPNRFQCTVSAFPGKPHNNV